MRPRRLMPLVFAGSAACLAAGTLASVPTASATVSQSAGSSPIKHVVVIYQENHSFDETLGAYCHTRKNSCDGYTGPVKLKDGTVVKQHVSPDIVPESNHNVVGQLAAINGGAMNGWAQIKGCEKPKYACLSYYTPSQIPNLTSLADDFAISDRTFSMADSASWGGHLYPAAASLDGFTGDNPRPTPGLPAKEGWGCDSNKRMLWAPDGGRGYQWVPSCIPKRNGSGAYKPTPVHYVPTIFDSLDAAGDSWKIYGAPVPSTVKSGIATGYSWSICPSFAECRYGPQVKKLVPSANILTDAAKGTLPSYSVLTPSWSSNNANGADSSQHNSKSMRAGDNWIGKVVGAIRNGPNWRSTAIFITYDDCGCFYDHVAPPKNPDGTQQGPREPMVIVSPYAKAGFTDSNHASFASILAFTEHTFHLPPLNVNDREAYDYSQTFNYHQTLSNSVRVAQHPLSPSTITYLRTHPTKDDDDVT